MNDIKVGSEWVSAKGKRMVVDYVGKSHAICTWIDSGKEFTPSLDHIVEFYKPAPVRRTVWLNVYEDKAVLFFTKDNADKYPGYGLLWQQEVELIDPREGGTKP